VAIAGRAVLMLGEPGEGKSDFALRLIDRGAKLVADDQTELTRKGGKVVASAPKNIAGLLEVRGLGLFRMQALKKVPVHLVLQLARREWIERLPSPEPYDCLGVPLPRLRICPFELSAAIKVEMAVRALQDDTMTVGAFRE
jgi:HPr kinase/phosphorylase